MTELSPPTSGQIIDGWHHFPLRIYFSETDAGGVVYHGTWYSLAERARTEMLRLVGIGIDELLQDHGMIFVIRSSEIDWIRPARGDELIVSRCRIIDPRNSSMTAEQEFSRDGELLCKIKLRIVCVKYPEWKAARIPTHVRDALAPLIAPSGDA
ncbi:MAG: tol-pal system-associated acyl-CoA thioesterase [Alphaproteobacteria bacterium]